MKNKAIRIKMVAVLVSFLLGGSAYAGDNTGDWNINRDNEHALFWWQLFPGLQYEKSAVGFASGLFPGKEVVIGNASLAYVSGDSWGSLPRVSGMMSQFAADSIYTHYTNNHWFWYPEHTDHDAFDRFHATLPGLGVSQGSSGSELDDLSKLYNALAGFKPEVKTRLKQSKLITPVLEMLYRRHRVSSDAEYLSGLAHPSAFEHSGSEETIRNMAAAINMENIPPVAKLQVISDEFNAVNGRDFFETVGPQEKVFDVPSSVARVFRGPEYTKKIVVSAVNSVDINNRVLTYHWKVLYGDPARVRVRPLNGSHSEVEIAFDHQPQFDDPYSIPLGSRRSNLVKVGLFVHNGVYYSAPAFVTCFMLPNENRIYSSGKLVSSSYTDDYVHPSLSIAKEWVDTYHYDGNGKIKGWTRIKAAVSFQFSKEGLLIIETFPNGEPKTVQRVEYFRDSPTKKLLFRTVGAPFSYGDDGLPPIVSVTSPADGATVSGNVTIAAAASDTNGIEKVEFFINDRFFAVIQTSPYSVVWPTAFYADGPHTLKAKATDNFGQSSETSIAINVSNPPGSLRIVQPAAGATVSGIVSITAESTAQPAPTSVMFFINNHLMNEDTSSPFEFSWDSTSVSNGIHEIGAMTRSKDDQPGTNGVQHYIRVRVQNSGDRPPTVSFTRPAEGATVSGWVLLETNASDSSGIQKVDFYAGATLVGTDSSAPYSISWNTIGTPNGGILLKAIATDNTAQVSETTRSVTINIIEILTPSQASDLKAQNVIIPSRGQIARVPFYLPEPTRVLIHVYDRRGYRIKEGAEDKPAGEQEIVWDGRNSRGDVQPAGIYLLRVIALGNRIDRKVSILR